MRLPTLLVAAILALPAAASAQTASLNGKDISLPLPAGFCTIDPTREAETGYLEQFKQFVPGFVAFLPDCAQLEKWRQSNDAADLPSRMVLFAHHAPLDLDPTRPDRKASVARYCDEARTSEGEIKYSAAAAWLEEFRKFADERIAKDADADVGVVIGQDEAACYVAQANVDEKKLAGVAMAAATVVHGQGLLVVVADYAGNLDADQIGKDHALVMSYMPTLLAANP